MPTPPLVPTARIPELVDAIDIDIVNDCVAVWQAGPDKTRKTQLSNLRTLILTGGPATIAPVISGGTLLYIVPPADAGTQIASIPAAAGKSFILRRTSLGMMEPPTLQDGSPNPDKEFDILLGGGFQLTTVGDVLQLNERFELVFFQLAPVVGPGTDTGLEFIKGHKIVNTNYVLVPGDMNKVIHIRDNATNALTQMVFTIPDVSTVPANSVIILDTQIDGDTISIEHKIQTTGGQFIYMQGVGRTSLGIRTGEVVWLYADDEGWHVLNDFGRDVYDSIGKQEWVWKKSRNQLPLDGSLVLRSDYPRLWEYVQTLGTSLVTDGVWNTATLNVGSGANIRAVAFPYRGCFSSGDGTNFRLPDLRNMFIRGLSNYNGVADPERADPNNRAGSIQDDAIKAPPAGTIFIKQRTAAGGDIDGFRAAHNAPGSDNYDEAPWPYPAVTETRSTNAGFIPVINV